MVLARRTPPFDLALLYRGSLRSCNYACSYCPFAKRRETRAALSADAAALARFVDWIAQRRELKLGVLFTPWGEALVRRYYREAIVRLSQIDHVTRVVAQTNLAGSTRWLSRVHSDRVALWCSYHPSQVGREAFLRRLSELRAHGVRFSVGMVGTREAIPEIRAMRARLPTDEYLWINAYKRQPDYYSGVELRQLREIDPLFEINNVRHASLGRPCRGGYRALSVDAAGDVRRCHFVPETLGNLYGGELEIASQSRPCPNDSCGCHIGYVQLEALGLYETFGAGLLERIPERAPLSR